MDLDAFESFAGLDKENMLAHIDGLPDQLAQAWDLGFKLPLPEEMNQVRQVVIAGMGGSAIGADLCSAYISSICQVPVVVHRDYELPFWAQGPQTLVIGSSHSGNTEETLSSFQRAAESGCQRLAICTGGKLSRLAQESGAALWTFSHQGQPRAAVGYSFGLLLALFTRLGLIPDQAQALSEAVAAMRRQQDELRIETPVVNNLAKRLGGQLMERYVVVFGSGLMAPVARRWKGQISEVAKAWAQFEYLPEADHNTLAGIFYPEEALSRLVAVFLLAESEHPRNRLRTELTRKTLMLEGINTDSIRARGENALAQMWTALHLGDYTSYYLAMAYGVDPTPIASIEGFKREMSERAGE